MRGSHHCSTLMSHLLIEYGGRGPSGAVSAAAAPKSAPYIAAALHAAAAVRSVKFIMRAAFCTAARGALLSEVAIRSRPSRRRRARLSRPHTCGHRPGHRAVSHSDHADRLRLQHHLRGSALAIRAPQPRCAAGPPLRSSARRTQVATREPCRGAAARQSFQSYRRAPPRGGGGDPFEWGGSEGQF